jgi:uncharacterized cupredoxin-like copper-binding protein
MIASLPRLLYFRPMATKFAKALPIFLVLAAALIGPAGCGPDALIGGDLPLAPEQAAEILKKADWKVAEKIEVDIRQNEFRPTIIRLLRGEPYILIMENRDDVEHVFLAREFFKTTAILKLITNDKEIPGAFSVIPLKPGDVTELHFVPARDGWFPFEDGSPGLHHELISIAPLSRGKTRCMVGSFIVQE